MCHSEGEMVQDIDFCRTNCSRGSGIYFGRECHTSLYPPSRRTLIMDIRRILNRCHPSREIHYPDKDIGSKGEMKSPELSKGQDKLGGSFRY